MTEFPIMKGEARMAVGADPYFEVPLFSHVIDNLWQGCSPAEFPDYMEEYDYDPVKAYMAPTIVIPTRPGVEECHWLMEDDKPRFDKILNLFHWGEYVVPEGTEKVDVVAHDSSEVDMDFFDKQAKLVISWLKDGYKVLVHCQAGLNRSSMVVALVLMTTKDMGGYGMTPDQAIDHIRASRSPLCLCNDHFRQALKGLK